MLAFLYFLRPSMDVGLDNERVQRVVFVGILRITIWVGTEQRTYTHLFRCFTALQASLACFFYFSSNR